MRVLVIGGNGFLGSHIVDGLLANGHTVRVLDRTNERFRKQLVDVDYHITDYANVFNLAEALNRIDIVIHLASTTLPSTSNLTPEIDIKDNLIGTVKIIDQMLKMGIRKILFFSSGGTVYGNPQQVPVSENHPLNPICSHGIVKVSIEKYLFMYQELYGLLPVILRPSNPYGPRQGHIGVQGLISTLLYKVKHDEPIIIWGDGSIVRDYIFVKDFVDICLLCIGKWSSGIFNVGSGEGKSILDIVSMITDVTEKQPLITFEPARGFDVNKIILDISHTQNTFGWTPITSLRDGIDSFWQWIAKKNSNLE